MPIGAGPTWLTISIIAAIYWSSLSLLFRGLPRKLKCPIYIVIAAILTLLLYQLGVYIENSEYEQSQPYKAIWLSIYIFIPILLSTYLIIKSIQDRFSFSVSWILVAPLVLVASCFIFVLMVICISQIEWWVNNAIDIK